MKIKFFTILIILIIFVLSFFGYNHFSLKKINPDILVNTAFTTEDKFISDDDNTEDDPIEKLKVINMSAAKIDQKNIYTTFGEGSVGDGDWEYGLVDTGSTTKEYSAITFPTDKFTSVPTKLPPTKTWKQIVHAVEKVMSSDPETLNHAGEFVDEFIAGHGIKDNFNKYSIAARFLPDLYLATVNQIDVDSDGKKEIAVEFCATDGNHPCVVKIVIVKGDKIIFSADEPMRNLVGLVKADDSNGFYLKWFPNDGVFSQSGFCCPLGYRTTRFKLVAGRFAPVSETETMFAKVVNTDKKQK